MLSYSLCVSFRLIGFNGRIFLLWMWKRERVKVEKPREKKFFICFGNKCLCVFRFYAVPDTRDYITPKNISDQPNAKGIFSDFLLHFAWKLFHFPPRRIG
jgi:hypothetical protein